MHSLCRVQCRAGPAAHTAGCHWGLGSPPASSCCPSLPPLIGMGTFMVQNFTFQILRWALAHSSLPYLGRLWGLSLGLPEAEFWEPAPNFRGAPVWRLPSPPSLHTSPRPRHPSFHLSWRRLSGLTDAKLFLSLIFDGWAHFILQCLKPGMGLAGVMEKCGYRVGDEAQRVVWDGRDWRGGYKMLILIAYWCLATCLSEGDSPSSDFTRL